MKQKLPLVLLIIAAFGLPAKNAVADPSKYPQFAQQTVPGNVTPAFISVDDVVAQLKTGTGSKPLVVDVRSRDEFDDVHIVGAVSAPLAEFAKHIPNMPKDRPVVLY